MTTLSIPVSSETENFIKQMVKQGYGANKADVVRRALVRFAEQEAVEAVLRAQKEPTLRGNLRDLVKKIK